MLGKVLNNLSYIIISRCLENDCIMCMSKAKDVSHLLIHYSLTKQIRVIFSFSVWCSMEDAEIGHYKMMMLV